ncbi:MAG: hypothetical protein V9H26_17275 [Verrucomicrobiota bacterium]|nr:hypothetical protein [Verrucomicrobiota bacterium]MCC6823702.1 hypothetical protein [Limisphaerales bacterium]
MEDCTSHALPQARVLPNASQQTSPTYEAEAEEKTSETVIQKIFDELPVP